MAMVWLVLIGVDLALLWTPTSTRALGEFYLLDRVSLVAFELVALVPFVVLSAWVIDRLYNLGSHTGPGARRWLGVVASCLVGAAVGVLFGASWLAFLVTGEFLNWTGVRLWMANPVQMVQHGLDMAADQLVLVPISVVGGGLILGYTLPSAAARLSERPKRLLTRSCAVLGLGCLILVLIGSDRARSNDIEVSDPDGGDVYSVADRFRQVREERTGPAARTLTDLWSSVAGGTHGLRASPEVQVRRDSIVSLDRYLATARRSRPSDATDYNVFVILIESLRPDQLEIYGSRRAVMPHVDSLAEESRVYLDTYAQSSHSNYADLPPLSSHYPLQSERMHVYPENPPYPRVLIYDVLDGLGYRTGIFSSQNENWGGMANYLRTQGLDTLFHSATYLGPTYVPRGDPGFARYSQDGRGAGKIDDRATVDAAIDWIRRDEASPFFIYMNLQNSHVPYRTPDDFERRFGPDSIDFAVRFGNIHPDSVEIAVDFYANSLAYVDVQLGRLFEALEEDGRWDNTIVVLTGDTGQAFLEHGVAAHAGPLFNEVVRVPLVVRTPAGPFVRDSTPAQHVDVPPTVLDLLKLPQHPSFQGRSLIGRTQPSNGARYLVAQSPLAHQYAVVHDGWKLIYDARRGGRLLFHLAEDPGETVNLADERPARVKELEGRLGAWMEAQLEYYRTPSLYRRWYPPKLHVPEFPDSDEEGR